MAPVADLNRDISLLNLAAYSPLQYLLPGRLEAYEAKYATETSHGTIWRQFDRERSLTALMRVNVLKRLESSVRAFGLTLSRQLDDVTRLIDRIDAHDPGEVDSPSIADLDLDDPIAEQLAVGKNIKVLLSDVDLIKWRHDLAEDRDRLTRLAQGAGHVGPERDVSPSSPSSPAPRAAAGLDITSRRTLRLLPPKPGMHMPRPGAPPVTHRRTLRLRSG